MSGNIKPLVGLDLFRIFAAFIIFLFHANIHIAYKFGLFEPFIKMGAIFMTAFFMLSGFVLYYTVHNKREEFFNSKIIKKFYVKRLWQIMPQYLVISTLWVIFFSKENLSTELVLFPITILGIESVFTSLFNISHYGGTWFISCILFCYFIFPLLYELISKGKYCGVIYIIVTFILTYSPFIVEIFKLSNIYSNPFFRILEFTLGIILAKIYLSMGNRYKILFSWPVILLEFLGLILIVTYAVKRNFYINNYPMYNIFALPLFSLMIFSLSGLKCKWGEKSYLIKYLSSISYLFYLTQFFVWPIVININDNLVRFIGALLLCLCMSIIFYELMEKPLKKLFLNKYNGLGDIN